MKSSALRAIKQPAHRVHPCENGSVSAAGARPGLQIRWGVWRHVPGGFDSRPLPPTLLNAAIGILQIQLVTNPPDFRASENRDHDVTMGRISLFHLEFR